MKLLVGFDSLPAKYRDIYNDVIFVGQSPIDNYRISDPLPNHKKALLPIDSYTFDTSVFQRIDERDYISYYLRRFRNVGYIPYDLAWLDTGALVATYLQNAVNECDEFILFSNLPHQYYDNILLSLARLKGMPVYFLYNGLDGGSSKLFDISDGDSGFFSSPVVPPEKLQRRSEKLDFQNLYYMSMSSSIGGFLKNMKSRYKSYRNRKFIRKVDGLGGQKFAVLFLHMQPELTTNAIGKGWESPLKILLDLYSFLPKDWIILIREHPNQKTHYGRSYLFNEIVKTMDSQRIFFSSAQDTTSLLINKTDLVVTCTGTVALESLSQGVNAMYYGDYPVVEPINGLHDREGMSSFKDLQFHKADEIKSSFANYMHKDNFFSLCYPSHPELFRKQSVYGAFVSDVVELVSEISR